MRDSNIAIQRNGNCPLSIVHLQMFRSLSLLVIMERENDIYCRIFGETFLYTKFLLNYDFHFPLTMRFNSLTLQTMTCRISYANKCPWIIIIIVNAPINEKDFHRALYPVCCVLYVTNESDDGWKYNMKILHSTNDLLKCIVKNFRTNDISVLISFPFPWNGTSENDMKWTQDKKY